MKERKMIRFCPFCGSKNIFDQGGDEEHDQAECLDCSTYFSVQSFQVSPHDFDEMDGDAASALASAGFGTDEDYGSFGGDE
jgi:hypothetical protein